jgi:WD40 repeat protein
LSHPTIVLFAVLLFTCVASAAPIEIADVKRKDPVDFQAEILPILKANCLACHNAAKAEGELVLETPKTIAKGSSDGPVVVPRRVSEDGLRDSSKSRLLELASHRAEPFMPPADNKVGAKPLSPEELGLIKLWIDQGAVGEVRETSAPVRWRPLPRGLNPIYALALSADGQFAACSRANQVFIYHVPSGRLVTRLADPALARVAGEAGVADLDSVRSLAISPAGDLMASGGYRTVRLWRRPRNVERQHFSLGGDGAATETGVTAVAVSPNGRWLAAGATDKTVRIWDLAEGQQQAVFEGHTDSVIGGGLRDSVTSVAFSSDSATLYSAGLDGAIRSWDVERRTPVGRIDAPGAVNAIALIAEGTQLASAGPDKLVRLWSLGNPRPASFARPSSFTRLGRRISALAASADRKRLAVGGHDGRVRIVELADPSAPPAPDTQVTTTSATVSRQLFGHDDATSAPVD